MKFLALFVLPEAGESIDSVLRRECKRLVGETVILMNNASLTGAVYAKTVKIGKYSTLITAPADLP